MKCVRTFCVMGIVFGFGLMTGLAACGGGGNGGDGNKDVSVPQSDVPQGDVSSNNEDAYIDKDVSSEKQECLLGTNTDCSACGDVCDGGRSCQGGHCQCPATEDYCSGECKSLGTDNDCSGCGDKCVEGKTCKNGQCVAKPDPECLPSVPCVENTDCPSGSHCNKAVKPPACQKLYCGGYLTACSEDEMCLSQECEDKQCVEDCGGISPYGYDNIECGPGLAYSESCGTCPADQVCKSGECVCEPEDHKGCCDNNICWKDSCGNDGTILTACPLACLDAECVDCAAVGKANCSGTCKLLGTDTDCSACGDACDGGKYCQEGACLCYDKEADCSGKCTQLGTNSDCSACGDACEGYGVSCIKGACLCFNDKLTNCSGICKPLGTDSDCSACGDACGGGKTCQDGQCLCSDGQTVCSGTCTPLGTGSDCSKCGDVCKGGKTCQDGQCLCLGMVDCSGVCTTTLPADFSCVGNVKWADPTVAIYHKTIAFNDALSGVVVKGVTVKVCKKTDDACASPMTQATTDDSGGVTIDLPSAPNGMDGYLEFSAAGYPTTLAFYSYVNPAAVYGSSDKIMALLVSSTTLSILSMAMGVTVDQSRGLVMFGTDDCSDAPTDGIAVSVGSADDKTVTAYMKSGMPDKSLTVSQAEGQGTLMNVPVGWTTITGTYGFMGEIVIGKLDVLIRPGSITSLNVFPTACWPTS